MIQIIGYASSWRIWIRGDINNNGNTNDNSGMQSNKNDDENGSDAPPESALSINNVLALIQKAQNLPGSDDANDPYDSDSDAIEPTPSLLDRSVLGGGINDAYMSKDKYDESTIHSSATRLKRGISKAQ